MVASYGGQILNGVLSSKSTATQVLAQQVYGLGAQYGVMLPYSRKNESEADHLGLVFAAMAGYNPEAAIGFWQRMASAGAQKIPEFMSTHPSDVSRINNIKKLIPEAMKYYKTGQTQLPGQSQKQTSGKSSDQQPYRFEKVTK